MGTEATGTARAAFHACRPVRALANGPALPIAAEPGHRFAVDVAVVVAVVVLALAGALVALVARRRYLGRGGGIIECAVRGGRRSGDRRTTVWRLGVGRYAGDELRWYRIFGLWPTAETVLSRRDLEIVTRGEPTADEHGVLGADAVIITCRSGDGCTDLAMSRAALTGFLAWLEAAPPGAHVTYWE